MRTTSVRACSLLSSLLLFSAALVACEQAPRPGRDAAGARALEVSGVSCAEAEGGRLMSRIGVFVCHCGSNIGGTVDCPAVAAAARRMPGVVHASDYKYMCSEPGQKLIQDTIAAEKLDRVVVASCSPRMHEPTFRRTVAAAGVVAASCVAAGCVSVLIASSPRPSRRNYTHSHAVPSPQPSLAWRAFACRRWPHERPRACSGKSRSRPASGRGKGGRCYNARK